MNLTVHLLWTALCTQVKSASVSIEYINAGLTTIPISTDPLCTHLQINNNFVSHILANEFVSYPKLEYLNLRNNSIESIAENAFSGLTKLDYLSLETNIIQQLPINLGVDVQTLRKFILWNAMDNSVTHTFDYPYFTAFTSLEDLDLGLIQEGIIFNTRILPRAMTYIRLTKKQISRFPDFSMGPAAVETLRLEENHIAYIPEGHMAHLSKLIELRMGDNILTSLPVLSSMAQLETLQIENNQLITMPDLYTINFTGLKIAGNPLECNQSLCWIRMWPWMKTPMLQDNPICASPLTMQGIALMDVPPTHMRCYNGMPTHVFSYLWILYIINIYIIILRIMHVWCPRNIRGW